MPSQLPSGRNGPHVFVDDLVAPFLAADDDHHVRKVLRVRTGEPLTLSDGKGSWCPAVLTSSGVELAGEAKYVAPAVQELTVGFALTKAHKPELAVQKLTEIGMHRIVPFVGERSVVRWDSARAAKNHSRLQRVAREAAMQSRRVYLPTLATLQSFSEAVLTLVGDGGPAASNLTNALTNGLTKRSTGGVVVAEMEGPPLTEKHHTVLIGPEGGWSDTERELLPTVGLGSHILRAETASIVAGALLMDRHSTP